MNFKKMELYGFKSFADKVQVNFESGVTGIVGPNGCGKSNVADAVRWVLGEQSAKALRGSTMQDVIFNGTEARKAQSFSEVVLTFDNKSKIFNVEFDEVVISRKLYRSGESEYAINKSPVRLKDIAELLRDSGLGKESYSIIGQGRIDEILSAKPEDRRSVFEEAAGISKLKFRKTETEKKLAKTQENLTRLTDILHELELQLGPLKTQAETAKKYLELKERLKFLEINTYLTQYDNSSFKKSEITNRLAGINEDLQLKNAEFDKSVNEYNETFSAMQSIDDEIEQLRDELLELTVGLEKQAGESRLIQEKISNSTEQNKKLTEIVEKDSKELETIKNRLEELKETSELKHTYLNELNQKIEKLIQEIGDYDQQIYNAETKIQESNTKILDNLDKLSDVKAKLSGLSSDQKAIDEKLLELSQSKTDLIKKVDAFKNDIAMSSKILNEAKKERQKYSDLQKRENQNQVKISYKKSSIEEDIREETAKFHSLTSRYKLLLEMQKENEGYISSIKKILSDAQTNVTLGGKFVGVVAKLMKVDEKYESAIEMALGASIQNIVTKNENDAKFIIEYLKQNNLGRATFMPITSMKERSIPNDFMRTIKSTKGVYGVAVDLIEFDDKYYSVFSSLLGSTVIVENVDVAIQLAKATKYGFKIVTLDGDVINPQGTIAGGSKKVQAVSLIGREREIQTANEDIIKCKKKIEVLNSDLEKTNAEIEAMEKNIQEIESKIYDCDMLIVKETENLSKINLLSQELISSSATIEDQSKKAEARKKEIKAEITLLKKYEEQIENGENATEFGNTSNPELILLKKRKNQTSEDLTELKIKKAAIESELVSVEGESLRLVDEQDKLRKEYMTAKLELQKSATDIAEYQEAFLSKAGKAQYDANLNKLQSVRDQLSNKDGKKDELSASLSKIDDKKLLLSSEIQRVSDKKAREENNLLKIDSDIEIMQEKIWEDYGLTYSSATEFRASDFVVEPALAESSKIKKQINSLGEVNVNAIESLKNVGARYEELSIQHKDLITSEEDLNKIMSGLVVEMQTKFKSEFEKINTNFQSVFKELFGGGKAELMLSDPANPLDCGIDIVAEPTGKRLQNITLLSGGERALTAIAILFAILKLKPMPFCILDEIEAALDDANAERFAKYLKRFSNYTQFIVITHRKPTMELADTLYGVTMEERGVSKIVSVQLSEALKNSVKVK